MSPAKHLLILSALLGNEPSRSGELDAAGGRAAVEEVFRQFRQSGSKSLIWSHEGISSRIFDLDADYLRRLVDDLDVRIVLFVRYIDDWVESLYKERIRAQGNGTTGRRATHASPKLLPLAPEESRRFATARPRKSMLEEGCEIPRSVQRFRDILPSADFVVRSYDASRANGTVVSDAMSAMGLPVEGAFPDADGDAGVRNPSKPNLYSMLVYHLLRGHADADVIRAVTAATKSRIRRGLQFAPLSDRRFRFLSEENIVEARGSYEELRHAYPNLPAQPPYAPDTAERSLPKEDGAALLAWLRPDISEADYANACAAYAPAMVL